MHTTQTSPSVGRRLAALLTAIAIAGSVFTGILAAMNNDRDASAGGKLTSDGRKAVAVKSPELDNKGRRWTA